MHSRVFDPFLIYSARNELRCVHFALIVKTQSLNRKYPGGVASFSRKYGARSNGKITVACFMGNDIDEATKDLEENGLAFNDDFAPLDSGRHEMQFWVASIHGPDDLAKAHDIHVGVTWLQGRISNLGAVTVRYVGE